MANANDSAGAGQVLSTLTVPAKHVGAFRIGLLLELEFDGNWISGQAKEARKHLEKLAHPDRYAPDERVKDEAFDPFMCLGGPVREVTIDAEHLRQLGYERPTEDVTLQGDAAAMKHSCEAVARHFAKELSLSEYGGDEVAPAIAVVAWAAGEAKRLEAEWVAQHEAKREAEKREGVTV